MNVNTKDRILEIAGRRFKDSVGNYQKCIAKGFVYSGPITRYYGFPGRYKPMAHQITTADFICRYPKGFVFNAIGTGKTMSGYWAFDFLRQEGVVHRCLTLAPLSTLYSTHAKELKWNFPHLSHTVLHGSVKQRQERLHEPKDIYIINFDGLKLLKELVQRSDIDFIFIDELAIFRNAQTALWKDIRILIAKKLYVWGFTGSPMPKAPTDCYAQAKLINPSALPQKLNFRDHCTEPISFTQFKLTTMLRVSEWKWVPLQGWKEKCFKALQPSIRFTKEECLKDLPDCISTYYDVEMVGEQKAAYKKMLKDSRLEIKNNQITAMNAGVMLLKLIQICSGAIYADDHTIMRIPYEARLKVLKEIIDGCEGNVLIFVAYKSILHNLKKDLANYETAIVDSDTTLQTRSEIYQKFNSGELRLILATPGCMSHGLNLQYQCSTIVWWSPINRYDIYEQANGRISRSGQKNAQLIAHLQTKDSIESEVYQALQTKANLQAVLLRILEEN